MVVAWLEVRYLCPHLRFELMNAKATACVDVASSSVQWSWQDARARPATYSLVTCRQPWLGRVTRVCTASTTLLVLRTWRCYGLSMYRRLYGHQHRTTAAFRSGRGTIRRLYYVVQKQNQKVSLHFFINIFTFKFICKNSKKISKESGTDAIEKFANH